MRKIIIAGEVNLNAFKDRISNQKEVVILVNENCPDEFIDSIIENQNIVSSPKIISDRIYSLKRKEIKQ